MGGADAAVVFGRVAGPAQIRGEVEVNIDQAEVGGDKVSPCPRITSLATGGVLPTPPVSLITEVTLIGWRIPVVVRKNRGREHRRRPAVAWPDPGLNRH